VPWGWEVTYHARLAHVLAAAVAVVGERVVALVDPVQDRRARHVGRGALQHKEDQGDVDRSNRGHSHDRAHGLPAGGVLRGVHQ